MMTIFYRRLSVAFSIALALILSGMSVVRAQYSCLPSGSPAMTTGAITISDPTQTGRVVRDGRPSSCTGKIGALQNSTPVHADSYNFTNPTGQTACVTVAWNFAGCGPNSTEIVAYSTYNPAAPDANVIGDPGFSSTGTGSFSFSVAAGASYTLVVHEITPDSGCASYSFTVSYSTNCRLAGFDAANDGSADQVVFRPGNGNWNISPSSGGGPLIINLGIGSDITVAGDYTGDGNTDVAVYRQGAPAIWYTSTNPATNYGAKQWGTTNDIPVPGDYDRDGKTDLAVFRPSEGTWYVLRSSNSTLLAQQWGTNADVPFTGDFDGDRIYDFGIFRPNDPGNGGQSTFYVLESNFNYGFFLRVGYGLASDKVVPADYDGDGKTDLALWRPSEGAWYILRSSVTVGNPQQVILFGANGDIPQPADYDGDKKADIGVFRPSTLGTWYWQRSSDGMLGSKQFGTVGDVPATSYQRTQ